MLHLLAPAGLEDGVGPLEPPPRRALGWLAISPTTGRLGCGCLGLALWRGCCLGGAVRPCAPSPPLLARDVRRALTVLQPGAAAAEDLLQRDRRVCLRHVRLVRVRVRVRIRVRVRVRVTLTITLTLTERRQQRRVRLSAPEVRLPCAVQGEGGTRESMRA